MVANHGLKAKASAGLIGLRCKVLNGERNLATTGLWERLKAEG
jgi:hypothetical protein